MDSCIHVYEPVLLYKLRHCLLIYNNKNNYQVNAYVVIVVQNSQVNKKIGELNFGINNTLQRTNAMLKILNVV